MNRLLLLTTDPTLGKSVDLMLSHARMSVHRSDPGTDAAELASLSEFDLVLLDLDSPGGPQTADLLKHTPSAGPVLTLTGTASPEVSAGADVLTKPFHREELVARIHSILRHARVADDRLIQIGKMTIDLDRREVRVDGERVPLTGKEFEVLEFLVLRRGTTLTKEMFLNHLYGGIDEPELKIIDVFVCKIRKKLSTATHGEHYISTVWGRGYVLRDPAEEAANGAATGQSKAAGG